MLLRDNANKKMSNLTFKPCPLNCPCFAVDIYYGPCCVAQEHTNHVERLSPQISSMFLFTAPWHWLACTPPCSCHVCRSWSQTQTQRLVWQVSTHVRISLQWASTVFFFLKDVGSLPQHQHLVRLHCVSVQMMNHSWITTTGRGGGG